MSFSFCCKLNKSYLLQVALQRVRNIPDNALYPAQQFSCAVLMFLLPFLPRQPSIKLNQ